MELLFSKEPHVSLCHTPCLYTALLYAIHPHSIPSWNAQREGSPKLMGWAEVAPHPW